MAVAMTTWRLPGIAALAVEVFAGVDLADAVLVEIDVDAGGCGGVEDVESDEQGRVADFGARIQIAAFDEAPCSTPGELGESFCGRGGFAHGFLFRCVGGGLVREEHERTAGADGFFVVDFGFDDLGRFLRGQAPQVVDVPGIRGRGRGF